MISTLISQAEVDALPEDPRQRFVRLEEICRNRHQEIIAHEQEWAAIRESQIRYMTTVVAAAKYLKIPVIAEIEIPKRQDWSADDFDDFVSEVQFYTVQLMLEGADRNSQTVVTLHGSTKTRLTTLVSHLRDQVEKLDVHGWKKDRLLRQLDEFERQLGGPKLTLTAVAVITLGVASVIADVGGAATTVRQLLNQIEEAVGLAKDDQDQERASRLLITEEVRQLAPPRKTAAAINPEIIDDDIPF